jgi:hypothetical protein
MSQNNPEEDADIGALPNFIPPGVVVKQEPKAAPEEPPVAVEAVGAKIAVSTSNDAPATVIQQEASVVPVRAEASVHAENKVEGVLLEHGAAPYQFDEKGQASYFAKLQRDDGSSFVLWGKDIENALANADAKVGQKIGLENLGSTPVTVQAPVLDDDGTHLRDEKGALRFEPKDTHFNKWQATVYEAPAVTQSAEVSGQAPAAAKAAGPVVALPGGVEAQLRAIAAEILASRDPADQTRHLSSQEIARVAQHLNLEGEGKASASAVTKGAPAQVAAVGAADATVQAQGVTPGVQIKGGASVAEGLGALVGGAVGLVGAAGKAVGNVAHAVAGQIRGGDAQPNTQENVKPQASLMPMAEAASNSLPTVLPRLSEYRVNQVEKSSAAYVQETEKLWNSSTKMTALRSEIERIARERGLSLQDVTEQMKPGGDLEEVRERFNAEVSSNPDVATHKKAMDKALDSFVRQYGRAQEELLNPEQQGNPHYERYKQRLEDSHKRLEDKASGVPAFQDANGQLEPSHFEKLKEAVTKIMEKLKEVAQEFIAMFRGKSGANTHDSAPAP